MFCSARTYHPNKGQTDEDLRRLKMETQGKDSLLRLCVLRAISVVLAIEHVVCSLLSAYEVLSDGSKRTRYDQSLGIPAQESPAYTRQHVHKLQQQVKQLLRENGDLKLQNETLRSQQRDYPAPQ